MRLERPLAEAIARAAIGEPYRQIDVLTTREFARWLRERDIRLRWETIHHLWSLGVLHPIAVLEPAVAEGFAETDRLVPADIGYGVPSFVDLGEEVTDSCCFTPPLRLPQELADSLLWHPFQLWIFRWLARTLEVPIALEAVLAGPYSYGRLARRSVSGAPRRLIQFANGETHYSFMRILALLLAVEPLVHIAVGSRVRIRPFSGETLDGYFSWRDGQGAEDALCIAGLALEEAIGWHRNLAGAAQIEDPAERFRILFRHVSRGKRDRLKGKALRAHNLYDSAEVLRRYLEQYHQQQLPEEDDVIYGPQSSQFKARFYGADRTADFDRMVFRRIVRSFDLDPQPRMVWFVEGPTEEAFIKRLACLWHTDLNRGGVEILNLRGVGGLASDRLSELLELFRRHEVFPFISIDEDGGGEHLRLLRNYAARGLLPAGFKVWQPAFEEANFSIPELAAVAKKVATEGGVACAVSAQDIESEMATSEIPAGKAIERLWQRAKFYGRKGANWGRSLAKCTMVSLPDRERSISDELRPIEGLVLYLLRAQHSSYQATVSGYEVSACGKLIRKSE